MAESYTSNYAANGAAVDAALANADSAVQPDEAHLQHGFPLPYEVTPSYDPATRQFTLTPTGASFDLWIEGVKHTKTGTQTSPAHADVTGNYFVYYDENGDLVTSTTVWDMYPGSDSPVGYVYYNADLSDGIALFELHTAGRNRAWHKSQHSALGTFWKSGLEISGYTLNTATDEAVTFGIASGVIVDEDIETAIGALADASAYTLLYRSGTDAWTWVTGQTAPYLTGTSYIQANTETGGNFDLEELSAGEFVNYYLFALPALDSNKSIVIIPDQQIHDSLSSAQAQPISSVSWGNGLFSEIVGAWKLTFETKANFSSTGKVQLVEVNRLGLNRSQLSGNFSLGAHNALTDRDAADAHPVTSISGISTFGATLVDDADAATARATLEVTKQSDAFDRTPGRIVIVDHLDTLLNSLQPNVMAPMGGPGAGLGICPELPSGLSSLAGTFILGHDEWGNYRADDGSICCYSPIGYYRWGHPDNPTYADYGANSLHIVGADVFANETEANAAGYALHREFKDGGLTLRGVFHDKYMLSPNAAGNGGISVANGVPISLTTDGNYTNSQTLGFSGQLKDAIDLCTARGTGWQCMALWDYSWLAMISIAHGQAVTSATHCAWYDATGTTNFPKGCNDNALGDTNDASVLYTTAGDAGNASKPLTGSANHPAKVSHNGQICGVMDLNGGLWEVSLGVTAPGASATASDQLAHSDAYILKESIALADLTSEWNSGDTGSMAAWGDAAHLATLYDAKSAFFPWGSVTNWYRFGNGAEQVFSGDLSGDDYLRACCGIGLETGMSASGSNLFGVDSCYRYNRENLSPLSCAAWIDTSYAGVSARSWNSWMSHSRAGSSARARRAFA